MKTTSKDDIIGKNISFINSVIHYNALCKTILPFYLSEDILYFYKQNNAQWRALFYFADLLLNNFNDTTKNLYRFIRMKQLPITYDGHFIAYGQIPVIRGELSDSFPMDSLNTIVYRNLIISSYDYMKPRANYKFNSKLTCVKINPADISFIAPSWEYAITKRYQIFKEV